MSVPAFLYGEESQIPFHLTKCDQDFAIILDNHPLYPPLLFKFLKPWFTKGEFNTVRKHKQYTQQALSLFSLYRSQGLVFSQEGLYFRHVVTGILNVERGANFAAFDKN